MINDFIEIYENNKWGHGSGPGSLPSQTKRYRHFLQKFLRQQQITSVTDMGCGDWQFSKLLDWSKISYQGYDIVPSIIDQNRRLFSQPNISFHLYSGNSDELPQADLLIVKDVLQHLPNETIFAMLPSLSKYRYALITNCVNPKGTTINNDIEMGGFRYLDLRLPPFNLSAKLVCSYTKNGGAIKNLFYRIRGFSGWKKNILLIENETMK